MTSTQETIFIMYQADLSFNYGGNLNRQANRGAPSTIGMPCLRIRLRGTSFLPLQVLKTHLNGRQVLKSLQSRNVADRMTLVF